MPLYFAYGSNMDIAAMARRCPASRPLGIARLARHRFAILQAGYATVVRALVYIGAGRSGGQPRPGYMEGVIAAARTAGLPAAYLAFLTTFTAGNRTR